MIHHPKELLACEISCALVLASGLLAAGCGSAGVAGESAVEGATERLTLNGITLQTVLVPRYVGALNNGGSAVNATAPVAQAWETFSLVDSNGGSLESGDSVFIQAGNGQYFQAVNGGGSTLNAGSNNQLGWETFKVVKQSGTGTINNGDVIGLQDSTGSWVSAANGGGGAVFAYGGALGSWEQFRINGLPAGVTPPPPPNPPPAPPSSPTTVNGVSFLATLNNTYVGATNNGGSSVVATATTVQAWETFSLVDINGGSLESGDSVYVKAGNGQYFQALNGGGSSLNAGSNNAQAWETFKVVKKSGGGTINTGDVVGLQASTGSWVSAENGGGGSVFAYGGALGSWESFAIGIGAPAAGNPGWRLVWSDEFNGTGLDTSKWSYEVHGPGWVNHELEYYTARPDNVRVENGHLVVEGRHDFYSGSEYSSGRINTAGHASWTYGRMEASIQLSGGWGTWPAFWMMPDDFSRGWPACGEIDIMEEVGFDQNSIHGTTHSQKYNSTSTSGSTSNAGVTTGYHLYAAEWYPDRIDFFVDGQKYFTSTNDNTGDDAWPFHKNFYLILNLAIGGDWGGQQGVDPNIWPRQMLVDYVRVYQK
jgi:hypothetical protein